MWKDPNSFRHNGSDIPNPKLTEVKHKESKLILYPIILFCILVQINLKLRFPQTLPAVFVPMSVLDVQIGVDGVRKTHEIPPRVSVYDVIAKVKGCSSNYAGNLFRRLLDSGNVPECEEVSTNVIEQAIGQHGNRRPVLVATAEEIVQICCALPGNVDFRKHCASVVVRYLAGDLNLVEEIFRNRGYRWRRAAPSTIPSIENVDLTFQKFWYRGFIRSPLKPAGHGRARNACFRFAKCLF